MEIENFDRAVFLRDHVQAIAWEVHREVIEVAAWNLGQRGAAYQLDGLIVGGEGHAKRQRKGESRCKQVKLHRISFGGMGLA
jgi:hypothetical protein